MDRSLNRTLILGGVVWCSSFLTAAPAEDVSVSRSREIIEMQYGLKTPTPEPTLKAFRSAAEGKGGHLVTMESGSCTMDVPESVGLEAMQAIVRGLGAVVERNVQRRAVGPEIADLAARIKARRDHLQRLEKLFGDVDLAQTLALESETAAALRELDRIRGQLNYLRERSAMLRVTIRLETSAVARRAGSVPVAAPWVRSLSLENFLLRYGRQ